MNTAAHTPSRSSFPVIVAIVGLLLLFWFLASKLYVDRSASAAPAATVDRPSLAEHRGAAQERLSAYAVVDADAGRVRLPIERAMEIVVAEHAQ